MILTHLYHLCFPTFYLSRNDVSDATNRTTVVVLLSEKLFLFTIVIGDLTIGRLLNTQLKKFLACPFKCIAQEVNMQT